MPFFGEKHHNWKGGLPYCIVCGKQISRGCKRCWEHRIVKRKPKLTLRRFLADKHKQDKRFWFRFNKTGSCWLWTASVRGSNNYGAFSIGYKSYPAHRISWIIHFGKIPKGMCVCHHCDNPLCVNPNHLFLGTNRDNINDKCDKGRCPKGENNSAHKLTEDQVLQIRDYYKNRLFNMYQLADIFGVSRPQIGHIINRLHWKHI